MSMLRQSVLHVRQAIDWLSVMGFLVNLAKSQPEPQARLQWLLDTPPSSRSCSRSMGVSRSSPSHQYARAASSPAGHPWVSLVVSSRRVYGQWDSALHPRTFENTFSSSLRSTQAPFTRCDAQASVSSSTLHTYGAECSGSRTEPDRASEHRMDVADGDLPGHSPMGRPPSRRSPGLRNEPPPSPVGVPIPAPGCSGMQLSRLPIRTDSSSRPVAEPAATHPGLSRSTGVGRALGSCSHMVAVPSATGARSPSPPDSSLPVLRSRPGLPQVGDLHQIDCLSFLRQALLASRPAAVVETILASYRQLSHRQHEVPWATFQRWLPVTNSTVSKDDVLSFLQFLFCREVPFSTHRCELQAGLAMALGGSFCH